MRQLANNPRSYIHLSLILAAGALVAAACSSDDEPSTTQGQLTGGAPGTGGTGPTATSGSGGGAEAPSNTSGSGGLASGGAEGNPIDVPIDQQPPPEEPGAGGAGGAPPGPPSGALVPNCDAPEGDVPNLAVELVAGGLNVPLYVTGVPGDDTRLVIVEQAGTVRVLVNGVLEAQPFIDVSGQLINENEQGLLGMAFHPNYADNGLFYLHYSANGETEGIAEGDTVVAEFQVDASNRSVANPASRRIVLTTTQPQTNHNGGQLAFGTDGMLYLGLGDGGGQNDQHGPIGNGQSLTTLLGKILRIDPTGRAVNNAYSVPDGNLAAAANQPQALPEIWAYGLRNPWRFSFDACNGDLFIGDVGQSALEEIDYVAADAETRTIAAGLNFGWRIMEGTICGPQAAECTPQTQANLVLPIDEYDRDVGQSITGGYVYRGSRVPGLRGTYLYADFQTPHVFRFRVQDGQAVDRVEVTNQLVNPDGDVVGGITSFGTDNAGEVYLSSFADSAVYRIIQAP